MPMRPPRKASTNSASSRRAVFRSKSDLLMAAIDVAVVGDADPVAMNQRSEFIALGRGSREQRIRAAAC